MQLSKKGRRKAAMVATMTGIIRPLVAQSNINQALCTHIIAPLMELALLQSSGLSLPNNDNSWVLDSAANAYITPYKMTTIMPAGNDLNCKLTESN